MKHIWMAACSIIVLAGILAACGSNCRKQVATLPAMKGEKYKTPARLLSRPQYTSRCLLGNPRQRAYGKVMGYRASSLTIKDYQR